jgi:xylan 1,4-beta-xylosidase
MAYWTFSDVFEEQGVARSSFYGGFGVIAPNNIPKASLNALAILHKLGERRIAVDSDSVLATKLSDGSLAIAEWNYAPPGGGGPTYTPQSTVSSAPRTFVLQLDHFTAAHTATLYRVDSTHGNSLALFDQMGRPESLSAEQVARLQKAGSMAPAERVSIRDGRITTTVPPYGLVVLMIRHE